jgi:DNA-binding IclR family transcriptional regulator
MTVGLAALRSLDVPRIARPHLERLARETSETATLSIRQGWTRVYIDQVLSDREIRMAVSLGSSHSLHAGASSRAILAALSDKEIDEYLGDHSLSQLTDATITDPREFRRLLDRVRIDGFAISHGEREAGAGSVAAAIRTPDGQVWGSISLCGPRDRFDPAAASAYAARIAAAAADISTELGYDVTSDGKAADVSRVALAYPRDGGAQRSGRVSATVGNPGIAAATSDLRFATTASVPTLPLMLISIT